MYNISIQQFVNFHFPVKLDFFFKVLIFTFYKKIRIKLVVLSITLARMGTSLPAVREITPLKISIILESNRECAN